MKEGKDPNDLEWGREPAPLCGVVHADNIADCITRGSEPAVKLEESLSVIKIIEAAKRSKMRKKLM